jgi:hypothetical protein
MGRVRSRRQLLSLHLIQSFAQCVNLRAVLGVEAIEIAAAVPAPCEPFPLIVTKSRHHGCRQSVARILIQGSHNIVQPAQARVGADARFRARAPVKVGLAIEAGSFAKSQLRKIHNQRSTNRNKLAHGDLPSSPEFSSNLRNSQFDRRHKRSLAARYRQTEPGHSESNSWLRQGITGSQAGTDRTREVSPKPSCPPHIGDSPRRRAAFTPVRRRCP